MGGSTVKVRVTRYHQNHVDLRVNGKAHRVPVGSDHDLPAEFLDALSHVGGVQFDLLDAAAKEEARKKGIALTVSSDPGVNDPSVRETTTEEETAAAEGGAQSPATEGPGGGTAPLAAGTPGNTGHTGQGGTTGSGANDSTDASDPNAGVYSGAKSGSGADLSFLESDTVQEVRERLGDLTDDQLLEVLMVEKAHKNRKGVIDAVEDEQKRRADLASG